MELATQLHGPLVPVYRRTIQAAAAMPGRIQDVLCGEAMAVIAREQDPIVIQGSLTTLYCIAVRLVATDNVQRALQTELASAIMREETEEALRGGLRVIYCLAVHFALRWNDIVEPSEQLYPYMQRKALPDELTRSLRR